MAKLTKVKQVPVSDEIEYLAETRTNQLGISFPEYVRHLILNDTKALHSAIPFVSEDAEINIAKSLRDLKARKYTDLKTPSQIADHIDKLNKKGDLDGS